MDLGAAAIIGSSVSTAGNIIANERAFSQQKELNRVRYDDLLHYLKSEGATPSSIVSALGGGAAGNIPAASTSNNPVSDFGSSLSQGIHASAHEKEAAAAQDNANAALTNAETERQLALMKLRFEPGKYFADIKKALSEAFMNTQQAFLHGSMKHYYDELTKDVQQVRPWKIAGLRQGLLNDMATFGKIIQETKTSKALQGYYEAGSRELDSRVDVNKSQAYKNWNEGLNESLRGFRIQWENTLLSYGIDPTRPFWDNTARLMYTQPELFRKRMDMFISSLNSIDERIQLNLGEHYKEEIAAGYGLYKLNQIHQKNANMRSYRNGKAFNVISKLIPFLGGAKGVPGVVGADDESLMPWGAYWHSDSFKNRWNDWLGDEK